MSPTQKPQPSDHTANVSDSIRDAVSTILKELGEDPDREGLLDTPDRVERSLKFLTKGYKEDVASVVNGAIFNEDASEIIILRDIDLYSLCEHHLLPFFGKCHVAYIPSGRVIGLSKIPRLVEVFSRRLQVQERLTEQIAHSLEEQLRPEGVAVVIEAYHLCMSMRGIEKQETLTITSAMKGAFLNDRSTRMEFLDLLKQSKRL